MVRRLIGFFTENWALKLAALALALLLWLAVRAGAPTRHTFRDVPVDVDVRDPDWRLKGEPEPARMDVTVTGPYAELAIMGVSRPTIVLGVDRVGDVTEVQAVPHDAVRLPALAGNTRVLALRPDTIRLRYERLDSKTLPVRVATTGALPAGLMLAQPINAVPALVEVHGPAADLDDLDSVPLLPVDLSGLHATANVPTSVDTLTLAGLRVSPHDVNVLVRIVPADSQPVPGHRGPEG